MDNIHKFCHLEHINKHFLFVQFLFFPFHLFSRSTSSYIDSRRCEQRNILQTNKFLVCWIENVHEHAWSKCVLCRFLCFDWDAGCVFFHIMIISCSARLIRSYFTLLLFHTFSLVSTTACFHLCMWVRVCVCVNLNVFFSILKIAQPCYPNSIASILSRHFSKPTTLIELIACLHCTESNITYTF